MQTIRFFALSLFFSFANAGWPAAADDLPVVDTGSGKVSGLFLDRENQLAVFRGIPYAQPPLGELRWKPPRKLQAWSGTRACREFSPAAPQIPLSVKQDEDCLYLNVWTRQAGNPQARLPVMVWIHGGGLNRGSGHRPVYEGSGFANRDVVLVTVNYRLGALGFLAHPELSAESSEGISGNYGFLDQIEALKWVRQNISQFGGDPGNVTLFGESAGGTSVSLLCVCEKAKGLFHRAIIQSPWMFGFITQLAEPNVVPLKEPLAATPSAEQLGEEWARNLTQRKGKAAIGELRSLPPEKILQAVDYYPTRATIDGVVLTGHPCQLFREGRQADIPMMIGTTRDEGAYFRQWINLPTRESFVKKLSRFYGPEAEGVADLYPGNSARELSQAGVDFVTDSWFVQPARQMLNGMSTVSSKTFQYEFSHVNRENPALGAHHSIELPYVFNTLKNRQQRPDDQALADLLTDYWVQFARAGNPNRKGLPQWPEYRAETGHCLQLDRTTRVLQDVRRRNCDRIDQAWNAVYRK